MTNNKMTMNNAKKTKNVNNSKKANRAKDTSKTKKANKVSNASKTSKANNVNNASKTKKANKVSNANKTLMRNFTAAIVVLMSVLISACNSDSKVITTSYSPGEIALAIISSQESTVQLESIPSDDNYYSEYLTGIYGLDLDIIEDGVICYAGGVLAAEISVLKLNEASDVKSVEETLRAYMTKRASVFTGYAPDQSALLNNGIVASNGNYVALLVCDDPRGAQASFLACFSDDPPPLGDSALSQSGNNSVSIESGSSGGSTISDSNRQNSVDSSNENNAGDKNTDGSTDENSTIGDNSTNGSDDGTNDNSAANGAAAIDESNVTNSNSDNPGAEQNDKQTPGSSEPTDNAANKSGGNTSSVTDDGRLDKHTAGDNAAGSFGAGSGSGVVDSGVNDSESASSENDTPVTNDSGTKNAAGNDSVDSVDTTDSAGTDKSQTSESPPSDASDSESSSATTDLSDDKYNPEAILKAWRTGDASSLSEKNLYILNACKDIITSRTNDKMSDYEKELAIHDWIIDWAKYDPDALSNSPNAKPDPDNDNPYGLLHGKRAICSGFTSTFQLFMDMLNVRCISVQGSSGTEREDHAWNMVQIEGKWYCVDVTWNSPSGIIFTRSVRHTYFNVSSDFMRKTSHFWDETKTPVADSDKLYLG